MEEFDGYDLSFERMILAADARLGRELYDVRASQRKRIQKSASVNATLIDEGILPGEGGMDVAENVDVPFRAILNAVAGSSCCEPPNLTIATGWKEAAAWCRLTIREHVEKAQRLATDNPPARSALSREDTILLMDHVRACQNLLDCQE